VSRHLPIIPAALAALAALAVAAIASSSWSPGLSPTEPKLTLAGQQLRISQTRANQALIKLPNAKPGQVARGTTVVTVTGQRASVVIGAKNLVDVPGSNGGKLIASQRLWVDVRCAGTPCPASPAVYRGPLSTMGTRSLGVWRPGTHRTYSVRVWLLRGGSPSSNTTGDNVFQGSQAKFGLMWTATGA
jgi:hypothetical protein